MLKLLKHFSRSLAFMLFLIGIYWAPVNIVGWREASEPWKQAISKLDQNSLLWIFAIAALIYIAWIDIRPVYRSKRWKKASEQNLSKGVFVYHCEVSKKKLEGYNPFVEIEFYLFNGSGLPITITKEIEGFAKFRSTLDELGELSNTRFNHKEDEIPWRGSSTFTIRQKLPIEALKEEKEFSGRPEIRHIDNLFGEPIGRHMSLNLGGVTLFGVAQDRGTETKFPIKLPSYANIYY